MIRKLSRRFFFHKKLFLLISLIGILLLVTIYNFSLPQPEADSFSPKSRQSKDEVVLIDKAKGWVRSKWISAKKWWYKKVVLGNEDWPQFDDINFNTKKANKKSDKKKGKKGSGAKDFEYGFPEPDTFAYIWYASNQAQFCSALIAMKDIKAFRSDLPSWGRKVDYILIFAGDGPDSNDDEIYVDNPVSEGLVEKWVEEGGTLGGFNIEKSSSIRSDPRTLVRELKLSAFSYPYSWIILMEPEGIPLASLDILFDVFNKSSNLGFFTGQTVISAPRLQPKRSKFIKPFLAKNVKCFGKLSNPISTAVMALQPSTYIETRLKGILSLAENQDNYFSRVQTNKTTLKRLLKLDKLIPDLFPINEEFACNDELQLLPRDFGRADFEFYGTLNPSISSTYYVHFSMPIKPWEKLYQNNILPKLDPNFREIVNKWILKASDICNFTTHSDWKETKKRTTPNDIYTYQVETTPPDPNADVGGNLETDESQQQQQHGQVIISMFQPQVFQPNEQPSNNDIYIQQ